MKSSTTLPSALFSTISTALITAPPPPLAVAKEPRDPGRSGREIRIRNTGTSFLTSITCMCRADEGRRQITRSAGAHTELLSGGQDDSELWKPCAVPRFEPFAAIRYATDHLAPVVAPPYDVLSDADVDVLAARSPHNIVRIDVPRGGEDRYELAAKTLQGWLNEGILATEAEPSFTIYRMRFTDSTGVERDIAG